MAAAENDTHPEREIVMSRVFDAPRALVWQAWTDPGQIVRWWGPRGFSTEIESMELRPGGHWIHTMIGPDGVRYPSRSIFTEVVPLERIAYRHAGQREGGPSVRFDSVWTFTDLGRDRTELALRQIYESVEARDAVIHSFGAVEGARQTLGRLGDCLQHAWGGRRLAVTLPSPEQIELTRLFQAPLDDVYRAFTDGQCVARWWGPRGHAVTVEQYDARPGGRWRVLEQDSDGCLHAFRGEFRELVPGSRIVRTFEYEPWAGHVSVETISFEAEPGGTRVTVLARFASEADRDRMYGSGMESGAGQSFDRLEEALASGAGDFVIERSFDAPRALVFAAWTTPEHLMQWMGPKGSQMRFLSCDLRSGGMSFYVMTFNGLTMWGKAFYREVTAPSRLIYVQHFADESGAIAAHPLAPDWPREMLTQVSFTDDGPGRTRVSLRWSPITLSAAERAAFEAGRPGMTAGWSGSFDVLAELLRRMTL